MGNDGSVQDLGVVLFVDGDHAQHVEALRVAGYHVEVASTALEALHRAPSMRPDALIVPLLMPDMSGSDLAQRIGAGTLRPHTLAVVILTGGKRAPAGQGPTMAAGATFCNLPCAPGDLVAMVSKQLAGRGHRSSPPAPPRVPPSVEKEE